MRARPAFRRATASGASSTRGRGGEAARGRPRDYVSPYLAGVGVGLVLLAAYVIMGRGLGASGAFSSVASVGVAAVAPAHAAANAFYGVYLDTGDVSPLADWLVFEVLGVTLGGLLSAWLAGRFRFAIDRGPRASGAGRLGYAFLGGAIMGFGAKLARGCTSGQALTGGALLAVGSWLFILGAFATAYLAAPLFRRQWT